MIDTTQIIVAIIGLLAAILTGVAIPWIKAKLGAQRWDQLQRIAYVAVQAAEQMGANGLLDAGMKKLEYATERVKEAMARQGFAYDADTVRAAIEASVLMIGKN